MLDENRFSALTSANERNQKELAERMRAELEAAQLARELSALHTATLALLSTLDLETLLGQILDAAISAIPAAEKGMLYLIAPDTGNLELRAAIGYTDPRIQKFSFPGVRGFIARAVRERTPQMIDEPQAESLGDQNEKPADARLIQSAIAAPLILEDKVLGAISLDSSRRGAFRKNDLRLLVGFAATATIALRNAQLHAEVQKLAITDSVTAVYNRRGFLEFGRREIERTRRFGRPLTAIMIDVDGFKEINDLYGHAAGDQVLRDLAQRFVANVREVDIVGRYGGDEFAILLPETDLFVGSSVAERLRTCITNVPFAVGSALAGLSISQGVARVSSHNPDLQLLLERADAAMYQAKQAGRNRIVLG